MIPDDEEPEPIDFSWFYFIGHTKLLLSFHDVGRMTLTTFNKLYKCYRDTFDTEMRLKISNTTYQEMYEKAQKDEEWF